MTKTQELLAKVAAGTHRIDAFGRVTRWVESRKEWVTHEGYRSDVVMRAQVVLQYGSLPLRTKLCTPVDIQTAGSLLAG